jgi:O-antigen/teichoic acid export membrane protein
MVKRALLVSIAAEGITTLAMLLTFRLAADAWGAEGLSEWVLARRVVTLVFPAAVLGLDIALTLALARHSRAASELTHYLAGALPAVVLGSGGIALLMALFPSAASTLLFGSSNYVPLLAPVAALIGALGLHVVMFAFLRGTMHFVVGNILHVLVYGALPIAAILVLGLQPGATLLALSAGVAVVVVLVGFQWLRAAARARGVLATTRELLHNGLPRVPAAFGVLALFGIPPIAVAHVDTLVNAAFLSLGMSLVTISGSAFSPLAVVLLPVAARARAAQNTGALLSRVAYLIPFALVVGVGVAVVLLFASDLMSRALIGHPDPNLTHIFRWVGLAAAPYIYFVCIRPLVDAHASSFTITGLVIGAGLVFVVVAASAHWLFGFAALDSALFAHVGSVYALALGTYVQFRRLVRNAVSPAGE